MSQIRRQKTNIKHKPSNVYLTFTQTYTFFHLYHETNINNHTDRYMYVCVYFEVNLNKHRSTLLGVTMWETEWASWWLVTGVPCTVDRSRCPMALDDSWCVWHLIYANHINCLLSIVNVQRCSMTTGDLKVRLERISRSKKSTFRIENRAKNQKECFSSEKVKVSLAVIWTTTPEVSVKINHTMVTQSMFHLTLKLFLPIPLFPYRS